tara:strand:- start:265 stop:762 length:498 start_codon:yes stop_codon:yes gene_type:complete
MGIHDRDYMRDSPPPRRPRPGRRPAPGGRTSPFPGLDSGLILGIALVAIGFSALIIKGWKAQRDRSEMMAELAEFDPYFNGGFPQYNIHTVTEAQLAELPMMTPDIARGIVERRAREPFKLTEELREVRGIEDLNLEMFRMYLFGFEDAPEPRKFSDPPPRPPDA